MSEIKIGDMVELFTDPGAAWEVVLLEGDRVRVEHQGMFLWAHKDNVEKLNQTKAELQRGEAISYIEAMPESGLDDAVESLGEMVEHWVEVDKIRANPPPEFEETTRIVDGVVIKTVKL